MLLRSRLAVFLGGWDGGREQRESTNAVTHEQNIRDDVTTVLGPTTIRSMSALLCYNIRVART